MDVRLTSEEGNVLLEILEERDRALLERISHAKREAPKKVLKDKETLVESIIEKLEAEQTGVEEFTDLWW
jgi:vacuolar-type H+-ATPase subunit E/Vma4